ncbi:hypothetical protein [Paenibacillus sp. y28]
MSEFREPVEGVNRCSLQVKWVLEHTGEQPRALPESVRQAGVK